MVVGVEGATVDSLVTLLTKKIQSPLFVIVVSEFFIAEYFSANLHALPLAISIIKFRICVDLLLQMI